MTGVPELNRAPTARGVPWDPARERRVLARALVSWRQRARRMRALELSGAILMVVLLGRISMRGSAKGDDDGRALAVPEAGVEGAAAAGPPISRSSQRVKQSESTASGGFAGTGGHGGAASTGLGGNAGTG
jgi:hypothetical protein